MALTLRAEWSSVVMRTSGLAAARSFPSCTQSCAPTAAAPADPRRVWPPSKAGLSFSASEVPAAGGRYAGSGERCCYLRLGL